MFLNVWRKLPEISNVWIAVAGNGFLCELSCWFGTVCRLIRTNNYSLPSQLSEVQRFSFKSIWPQDTQASQQGEENTRICVSVNLNGCLLSFSVVCWQGQLRKPIKSFSVCQCVVCSWAWESCDQEWKLIWVLWPPGFSDHVAPLLNLFYMPSGTCMPNLVLLRDLSPFS